MEHLSGSLEKILFSNEDNGFAVAKLNKRKQDREGVTIVGNFASIKPGETINCKGHWKHHPKFGKQFIVENYTLSTPKDLIGIQRYLESGLIKGIGPTYANRIVEVFGLDTLEVIDKTPERLLEVDGIGPKRIEIIEKHWDQNISMREVIIFLRSHGIGPSLAQKIYKKFQDKAIDVIKANPYTLAKSMFGVGFKTIDKIAKSLGIEKNHPMRVLAGIEYVLKELSNSGHTCYPEELLLNETKERLEIEYHDLNTAILTLEEENVIVREEVLEDNIPILMVWIKYLYIAEKGINAHLKRINNHSVNFRHIDVEKAILWSQDLQKIRFAKEQIEALSDSLGNKIHIITGGPGTGKSTLTKAILSIHLKLTENILLAAPTGKAAKRLSQITRNRASTIHSLLEYDFTTGKFKRGKDNPLPCDLIIIDEASMIDTLLMFCLLKAIPSHARVIIIGDIDQLPSIGPGNVLHEIIATQLISTSRLKQIFRQGKGSMISLSAHNINKGLFPILQKPKKGADFLFFEHKETENILSTIIDLNVNQIPQAYNLAPLHDIQILSPMRKGIIGIDNLNQQLQHILNPRTEGIEHFGHRFKVGDKVMQIRNNYSKKVFNGDVGFIDSIDVEEKQIHIHFNTNLITYEYTDMDEIRLAYSVSIHKYQGSEAPCIIIPIHTSHFKLLQRNLLYTAITRGKRLVILVGDKKAIAIAIQNNDVKKRYTSLSYFISTN